MASVRQPVEPVLEPDSDWLEEVIDGEVWKLPPPSPGHADLVQKLQDMLNRQLDPDKFMVRTTAYGQGIAPGAQYTSRIPDLAVFDRAVYEGHLGDPAVHGSIWVVPNLIVECLSPANRKKSRLRLMLDYERIRTPEVWLIYPERRSLDVYVHDNSELQHEATFNTGTLRPRLCPADVNIDQLWKAFDRA
jgi:Uma2 family endonuclease